jgi:hypothetical protein
MTFAVLVLDQSSDSFPNHTGASIMEKSVKENLADAGRALGQAASKVGEKIAHGTEKAVDAVSNMAEGEGRDVGLGGIQPHMQVIASCGKCVGVVDGVESGAIKLTRKDSPDGQHHFIPKSWVDHVDSHVHLTKNSKETETNWKASAGSCNC